MWCVGSAARADVAETRGKTPLRAKPSASSKAIDRIPAGTQVPVMQRSPDGEWLDVLFGAKEGWIPAAEVTVIADEVEAPKPKKKKRVDERHGIRPEMWVAESRFHDTSGPGRVVVNRDRAELLDRPVEGARVLGTVERGRRLEAGRTNRDGKWYLVELDAVRMAWIPADAVAPAPPEPAEKAPSGVAPAEPADGPPEAELAKEAAPPYKPGRLRLHVDAGPNLAQIEQRFASTGGTGPLANYGDRSGLVGVEVGLGVDFAVRGGWVVGLAGGYRFDGAADVAAPSPDGTTITLALRTHDVEALALLGRRFEALGGLTVALRAGARLLLDLIDQDYLVAIPSERVVAFAVGAGVEAPRLVGRFGLALDGTWLPVGVRDQTPNLREGDPGSPTSGFAVAAAATYALTDHVLLYAAGRYTTASTHFTGKAQRDAGIDGADRSTTLAALSVGLRLGL